MRNVGCHLAAELVFVGHFLAHAVKSGGQLPDLVVRLHNNLLLQLPLGDALGCHSERLERAGQRAREDNPQQQRHQQRAGDGVDQGVIGVLQELGFLWVESRRLAGPENGPNHFAIDGDRGAGL